MTDDLRQYVEQKYRHDFEAGRLAAGYEAILFCLANGVAVPAWLTPTVKNAVKRDFLGANKRGQGNASPQRQSRRVALEQFIVSEVDRLVKFRGLSKVEAFDAVATDFLNNAPDGRFQTAESVKRKYYELKRLAKSQQGCDGKG